MRISCTGTPTSQQVRRAVLCVNFTLLHGIQLTNLQTTAAVQQLKSSILCTLKDTLELPPSF